MKKYYITIVEVSTNREYAIFERSDGEYGWLEFLDYDACVGDVLEGANEKSFIRCGETECLICGSVRKVYINDYGFEKDIRKQYSRYVH